MKRFVSVLLSLILVLSVGTMTVSAESLSGAGSSVREESGYETETDGSSEANGRTDGEYDLDSGDEDSEPGEDADNAASDEGTDTGIDSEQPDVPVLTDIEINGEYTYEPGEELTLEYDDRYSFEDVYPDYVIDHIDTESVSSSQVTGGKDTGEPDEYAVMQDGDSDTDIIAAGVGKATVYLLPADVSNTDDAEADADESGDGDSDEITDDTNISGEVKADGISVSVTVTAAPLTLMFLIGQSNMEGYCSSDYLPEESVVCTEGTVYSTYTPSSISKGDEITGLSFSATYSESTAASFVAGSLTGSTNINGGILDYPLDSLTSAGNGKCGPDAGLAWEWNRLSGDKVWVVNTAYGSTSISKWVPGGTCYDMSAEVWEYVLQTYNAEIGAGHYTADGKYVFWLQGESDYSMSASDYETSFSKLYYGIKSDIDPDGTGIIMVRASTGSYTNSDELTMTGPRIAQYSAALSYPDVYVVSNVNEQWISNSGVRSYFSSAYSGHLPYSTHNSTSISLPSTMNAIHSNIHYSQIGHNENGITAADGMYYAAVTGSAVPTGVSWAGEDGYGISSLTVDWVGEDTALVPIANPSYAVKKLSYSVSGDGISYDASAGILTANAVGTYTLTAYCGGNTLSEISVTVKQSDDLTALAGNYTGIYHYGSEWLYLENGIIQSNYEGVEQNSNGWWYIKNGKVDFTYTGFAENTNGWWYIEKGKVTFKQNTVLKGTVNSASGWWYVIGSKVQLDFTGLANYSNSNGWWYIEDGMVDFTANTVAKNKNGWWYVEEGKVDFSYNGFGENSNGQWYIEKGKVTFSKNSVLKDTSGAIGDTGDWYYVVGSKVQDTYTGVANYKNSNGWWYIKDGMVDFTANTVAKNKNGWWYVAGGKVNFSYTGFAENSNGWWYIENGKVTFKKNSVIKGDVDNTLGWWYVVGSKVQKDFTGLANYSNSNGWWYIRDGMVDFTYNGIAENKNGWWYIINSKVDFSYTGKVTDSGVTYSVKKGRVNK